MLSTIRESWSWIGVNPAAVTATNAFGNVIVRATNGVYWRICPEELTCEIIAANDAELTTLQANKDFQLDWEMTPLVKLARRTLGPVDEEHCYCLKLHGPLGGKYDADNFGIITRLELLSFTGHVAEQIKDVPDGGTIQFEFKK